MNLHEKNNQKPYLGILDLMQLICLRIKVHTCQLQHRNFMGSTRIKKTIRKMENKAKKKNRKGEKRGNFAVSHTIERSELLLY
jgi:hypothetical protein